MTHGFNTGDKLHRASGSNQMPHHALDGTHRDRRSELAEDALYAPYLARQDKELRDLRAAESLPLGDDFPYAAIPGLSREMVERLSRARPATLAAAGRVPGITPAALAALLVHARRRAA